MLPVQPQSIVALVCSSISSYKKYFIKMLPVILSAAAVEVGADKVVDVYLSGGWFYFPFLIIYVLLMSLFFCWGMCLAHELLTTGYADYKVSFINAAARFFKTIMTFFGLALMLILSIGILFLLCWGFYSIFIHFNVHFGAWITAISLIMLGMVLVFFMVPFCSSLYYIVLWEVLLKGSGAWISLKKAFRVSARMGTILRVWGLISAALIVVVLVVALIIGLNLILVSLGHWLFSGESSSNHIFAGMLLILNFLALMLLVGFKSIVTIYICNDLSSRFDSSKIGDQD